MPSPAPARLPRRSAQSILHRCSRRWTGRWIRVRLRGTVHGRRERSGAVSDWLCHGAAGMCKRQEAAHISLPAMLRPAGSDGSTAAADPALCFGMGGLEPLAEGAEEDEAEAAAGSPAAIAACAGQDTDAAAAARDPQQQPHNAVPPPAHASGTAGGWVWRTHLEQSAPFWEGWYSGLSDLFLKLSVPKVRGGCVRHLDAPCRSSAHACSQPHLLLPPPFHAGAGAGGHGQA